MVIRWRLRLELVLGVPLGLLLPILLLRGWRIMVIAIGGRLVMARTIHRLGVLVKVVSRIHRSVVMVVMVVESIVERVMLMVFHGGNICSDRRQRGVE
jgi:hypothetical protein